MKTRRAGMKHPQPEDCLKFLEEANSATEETKPIIARFRTLLEHGSLDYFLNIFTRSVFLDSVIYCVWIFGLGSLWPAKGPKEYQFKNPLLVLNFQLGWVNLSCVVIHRESLLYKILSAVLTAFEFFNAFDSITSKVLFKTGDRPTIKVFDNRFVDWPYSLESCSEGIEQQVPVHLLLFWFAVFTLSTGKSGIRCEQYFPFLLFDSPSFFFSELD